MLHFHPRCIRLSAPKKFRSTESRLWLRQNWCGLAQVWINYKEGSAGGFLTCESGLFSASMVMSFCLALFGCVVGCCLRFHKKGKILRDLEDRAA